MIFLEREIHLHFHVFLLINIKITQDDENIRILGDLYINKIDSL